MFFAVERSGIERVAAHGAFTHFLSRRGTIDQ
jgi:hypothetical protein